MLFFIDIIKKKKIKTFLRDSLNYYITIRLPNYVYISKENDTNLILHHI